MRLTPLRSYLCLCALAAVLSPCRASAEVSLNLASSFAPVKAKLAAGQQADILILGDSLSVTQYSYLPILTQSLQNFYGNGGAGWQGFSVWTGAGFTNGWTRGMINQDTIPHHSLDGLWAEGSLPPYPPIATVATFTARSSHVQLHYVAQPEGGTVRIDLPGGGNVTFSTYSATEQVRTWEYTFTGTDRKLGIQPLGDGRVTVLGMNNSEPLGAPDRPGVRVHRAVNGGWGVNNYLNRDWTFDQQVPLVNPDLIFLWVGQNDQAYNRSTYPMRLNPLIDRLEADAPNAKIVLVGTYDSTPNLLGIVQAVEDVARQRGLGFINFYDTAGDYPHFLSNGMLADGLHFSQSGGQHIADIFWQAWLTDGASLTAGVPGDFNGDGLVNVQDINGMIRALAGGPSSALYGDLSHNNVIDVQDINPFVTLLVGGGSAGSLVVPEPAGLTVLLLIAAGLARRGGRR
ncbi:MAG: hypothetical protein IT442_11530 [Phycisphaeraceae bacterium]|nr:hypothetical protein [Phycisphaeraceae bacterium]